MFYWLNQTYFHRHTEETEFPNYLVINLHLIFPHFSSLPNHRIYEESRETFTSPKQITCQTTIDFLVESSTDRIHYLNMWLKLHLSTFPLGSWIIWETIISGTNTGHLASCPFQNEMEVSYICSFDVHKVSSALQMHGLKIEIVAKVGAYVEVLRSSYFLKG